MQRQQWSRNRQKRPGSDTDVSKSWESFNNTELLYYSLLGLVRTTRPFGEVPSLLRRPSTSHNCQTSFQGYLLSGIELASTFSLPTCYIHLAQFRGGLSAETLDQHLEKLSSSGEGSIRRKVLLKCTSSQLFGNYFPHWGRHDGRWGLTAEIAPVVAEPFFLSYWSRISSCTWRQNDQP